MRWPKLTTPSWRGAFFMLLSFVVVSAAIWSGLVFNAVNADAAFVAEWRDLFGRCRVAVESRSYPVTAGLVEIPNAYDAGAADHSGYTRSWALPGGRFVLSEGDSGDGPVAWRRCDVKMRDDVPLSLRQQLQLASAFREIEFGLISAGTHLQAQASVLGGSILDMFVAEKLNSAGCEVVAMIHMSEGTHRLPVIIGERGDSCAGPPLGKPGANPV